jgi:hypothetical protein
LAKSNRVSCDGNRSLPSGGCFGSEDPKRRPRDEMSLMVESIVDGGMEVEKTLRGSRRLESLHLDHPAAPIAAVLPLTSKRAGSTQINYTSVVP